MNYKILWERNDSVIVTDTGHRYMVRATYLYKNGVLRLRDDQYIVCSEKKILGYNLGWFDAIEAIQKYDESLKDAGTEPSKDNIIVLSDVVKEGRIHASC